MGIWKDVKGYEGLYRVSDLGDVYSIITNKKLKIRFSREGYSKINLSKNGIRKTHFVHRLVMETFNAIEGMDSLQVNHINEIKNDNALSNLEWCTAKENINYGNHNKKLSVYRRNAKPNLKLPVRCVNTGEIFESISAAARFYNIKNKSGITKVLKGIQNYCGCFNGQRLRWVYY